MCGFLFVLQRNGSVDEARFRAAFETMRHRGPDAHQVRFEASKVDTPDGAVALHAGLGHHRLAILDLDKRSNQPFGHDGRMLLYNGEIYNFRDVRASGQGANYKTSGDTEVLYEALAHTGTNALNAMNGMWSFCFFDQRQGSVLAARDRHGKKPLFFFHGPDTFCVASTITAITGYLGRPPVFAEAALNSYLAHGVIYPSGGFATHFTDIGQVPPGGTLSFDARAWTIDEGRYFDLGAYVQAHPVRSGDLPELIMDAVRLRLVSDRKVGLLLSGGVDSSVVLAALHAQGLQDQVTCFIGETGRSQDAAYARACVEQLGIEARTIDLGYGADTFERFLRMCRHHEKPFPLIGNAMAMSEMYQAIDGHDIPVVLDGTGGDEQFGGYWDRQFPFALADAARGGEWAWLATMARANGGTLARALGERVEEVTIRRLLKLPFVRHPSNAMLQFCSPAVMASASADPLVGTSGWSFEQALVADAAHGRLGEWLWHNDRNAMMAGIENRSPLLDFRLAPFMATGYAGKFVGRFNKHELRQAFDALVRLPTQWRSEKQGFRWAAKRFYAENRERIFDLISGSAVLRDRVDVPRFIETARARPRYLSSRLTPRLLCIAGLEQEIGVMPG